MTDWEGLPPPEGVFAFQATVHASTADLPRRAFFLSPRLGKTNLTTAGLTRARRLLGVRRGVVTCPLVVAPQWHRVLEAAGHPVVAAYTGATAKVVLPSDGIVVVNDDRLKALEPALASWGAQSLIVDESHRHAANSGRGKAMRALAYGSSMRWVRVLSGTPVRNTYASLWGQMAAIDRAAWGTSYAAFAREHLLLNPLFHNMVEGYRDIEGLQRKLLAGATIVRREDVFGPDSWQEVVRSIPLPPAAQRLYDRLAKEWLLDDLNVEAEAILKRMTRLQQLCGGFLPAEDGTIAEVHDAKVRSVVADLESVVASGEKAVIYHRFRHEDALLGDALRRAFPNVPVLHLHGGITAVAERERVFATVETRPGAVLAVVQTQSGGVGRSFAAAKHVHFYSQDYSFVDFEQARDRVFAVGLARTVTYHRMERTVDDYIASVLARKGDLHAAVRNADRYALAYGTSARTRRVGF